MCTNALESRSDGASLGLVMARMLLASDLMIGVLLCLVLGSRVLL